MAILSVLSFNFFRLVLSNLKSVKLSDLELITGVPSIPSTFSNLLNSIKEGTCLGEINYSLNFIFITALSITFSNSLTFPGQW